MAVTLPGPLLADISGSVGDVVFYRGRGGLMLRERHFPDETETPARKEARDSYRTLCGAWSGSLTDTERQAWREFAARTLRPTRFRGPRHSTGFHEFLRHSAHYCRVNPGTFFSAAPDEAPLPRPWTTLSADAVAGTLTIALPTIGTRPQTAGDHLYAYRGRPQPTGLAAFYGPWTFAGHNVLLLTWDHDPWTIVVPGLTTPGQRLWIRLVLQNDTTRSISSATILQCKAT